MKRLVLVDGNSLLHRAYHAMPRLTTKSGRPVNAVYGFLNMLFRVFNDLKPDYVAVSFDKKGPTFRHLEFKDYKAKRPKMDDELVAQVEPVHEVVESLSIPIFEIEGYEADDVIGTLAKQAEDLKKEEVETVIVTGDRDALQLVNEKVKVYCPLKGLSNPILYDEKKVREAFGLKPKQLIDYKALRGDSSDNIPGVKGIGEVTAKKLLAKYGSLEEVYKNLDEIEARVEKKLIKDKKKAYLSRRLGEIVLKVPIRLDLKSCRLSDYDKKKAEKAFEKYEFRSLLKRLPLGFEGFGEKKEEDKKEEKKKKNSQLGLF